MAEKSTGQWVGAVVGAIAGFFTGGTTWYYALGYMAQGAAVGSAVGGLIDPPKGPNIQGPRMGDLAAQSAGYGSTIPRIYGQMATFGNVFWVENNRIKEVAKKKKNGKGGGGSTTTTYSYYATFAVSLCRGPIQGVRRVWVGSKLIYDASSVSIDQIAASNAGAKYFKLYTGSDTQLPDERMEATLGVGNVPAYRGLAYLVFEDYPLKDHGNSLMGAQVKVEVLTAASYSAWSRTTTVADIGTHFREDFNYPANPIPYISRVENDVVYLTTVGSTVDSLYSLAGTYLGSETRTFVETTGYNATGDGRFDCGQFMTDYGVMWPLMLDLAKTIGEGALVLNDGRNFGVNLPQDHKIMGVAIANDRRSALVLTARPGEFYYASYIRDYYVIDDALEVIDSGLTDVALAANEFGSSRSTAITMGYGTASFDSETMRVATAYGAGSGSVVTYQIDDGVMAREAVILPGLSYWSFTRPTVFLKDDMVFAFSGTAYNVFTRGLITPGSEILGDIVRNETLQSGLLSSGDIDVSALTDTVRGYRISSVAAIRSGIEPLQSVWPFDVRQHGYQLQCVKRGGSAVATITEADLDARASGDKPGTRLGIEREMDSQLPRRIVLTHVDPDREYDPGEQGAERLNTTAVNVQSTDLPIVLTATEAGGAAEVALYLRWLERYGYSATLAPSWRHLEPADVVDIVHQGITHTIRLTSVHTLPDGRVEVTGRPAGSATLFTPVAVADSGASSTGVTLGLKGPTRLQMLDLPAVHDGMDTPAMLVAACGYYDAWPGGVVLRSDDGGTSWDQTDAVGVPGATMGQTINALSGVDSFALMDKANTLTVRLANGDLSSVTETALLAGANHFALGAHGRWEIIAAQTCLLQGDGTYVLRDFIRGRFGTEWAVNTHAALDTLVLLDTDTLVQSGVASTFIGVERKYRGVTLGQSEDEATTQSLTYNAVNLECLSPVYLNGNRAASNDWTITWVRRTRIGGEWRDKIDAPLSEASEAYEVEIYSDATYATLKRTLTGLTSATATYTSAQQTTDFGSAQTTLYLKVYQISTVAGRGYPLVSSLPRRPSTRLLMHGNGDNNGTVFTDEAGNAITPSGGLVTANDVAPVFGSAALKFNGSNAYFSVPSNFGVFGDFTIEFWLRGGFSGCYFSHPSNGTYFYNNYLHLNNVSVLPAMTLPSGSTTWRHVAVVRNSGVVTVYCDGVSYGSATHTAAVDLSSLNFGRYVPNNNLYVNGHMDEIRISDRAIYTAPFTPPASEFQIFTGAI